MNVTCPSCQRQLRVDGRQLPSDRPSRLSCPGCRAAFDVGPKASAGTPEAPSPGAAGPASSPVTPAVEAWLRRELGRWESELREGLRQELRADLEMELRAKVARLPVGGLPGPGSDLRTSPAMPAVASQSARTALVVTPDAAFGQQARESMAELGFAGEVIEDVNQALDVLERREFGLVVVDQATRQPGGVDVMEWLSRLPGSQRRTIFVVLASAEHQSMDKGAAFIAGANLTVNKGEGQHFAEVLRRGLEERDELYRVFHEVTDAVSRGG